MPQGGLDLRERVRFARRRENGDDGYGNIQYEWKTIAGPMAARIKPARGTEDVLAQRLSGVGVFEVIVRSSSSTRSLTPEDRCINVRSGEIMNIRSIINTDERNEFLSLMVQSGVAT